MKDVTDQVEVGDIDGGIIVILKCACGHRWKNWDRTMSLEGEDFECEYCHRQLRASYEVKVEEVE